MITCPKCNKELADGTKFCDACGEQIPEAVFCPNCGTQTTSDTAFCPNCGTTLNAEATPATEAPVAEAAAPAFAIPKVQLPKLPFNLTKKLIAMVCSGVALVVVVAILFSTIFTGGNGNFALYIKEKELFYSGLSGKPFQVTTDLVDMDGVSNGMIASNLDDLVDTQISKDGKTIFFMDKYDGSGATLYVRTINKPKKEAVKIDSNVTSYQITPSGKLVTYKKDGNLYQHNLKDKEKIASDVSDFCVSEDGKKLFFTDDEGDLYFKQKGKDKEKLDSEISSLQFVNEKFNTVYYTKEDTLYKKVVGKDKVKIASDVSSVITVYESGEMYFVKDNSEDVTLMDYVEDDMKAADAAMVEPEYPEYPDISYSDYSSFDEYDAAYDAALDEYYAARDEYYDAVDEWYDKEDRDELREELKDATVEITIKQLYYFNGKKETLVSGSYTDWEDLAYEAPVIVFSSCEQKEVEKVKLSEIDSVRDIEGMIDDALDSSSSASVAVKDAVTAIDDEYANDFTVDQKGKNIYFCGEADDEGNADLYKMTVSGKKVSDPKSYDSDVYGYSVTEKGDVLYYKDADMEDYCAELYLNKKSIDSDVDIWSAELLEDGKILYTSDESLKIATKGGKATTIADDVEDYTVAPDGKIIYLADYSEKNSKGTLFVYSGGKKSKQIDDDVVALINVYKMENGVYYAY